ncbi:MAG: biotin--[acetyl-CoA-carboxylase] ligase [Chloroflexia bacterium]
MSLSLYPGAEAAPLALKDVRRALRTRSFGRQMLHFGRVGSTNEVARRLARQGAPEGLLVWAEEQTAGRGRSGRRWEAPWGSALLVSLLLRPRFLPPERAFLLSALASLAIGEAVETLTGLPAEVKWPNDILVNGRKCCGILLELEATRHGIDAAVLGWGLNVNVRFEGALAETATSLAEQLDRPLPRLPLLVACLERLETRYHALRAGRYGEVWHEWRARLRMLGKCVRVCSSEGAFVGEAVDVETDGALLVRRGDGTLMRVVAGDVSIRPIAAAGSVVVE